MTRRYKMVAMSGPLVTGIALVFFGGCSDSTPPPAAPSTPQPVGQTQPESTPPKGKGKKAKNPFDDMGVKEKREYRKKQRAAEAAGQTP